MARPKKVNYLKLSVEDFIQTYNETVEKLNEMEEVAKSLNLKIRRENTNSYVSSNSSTQTDPFSQYVRTPVPNYSDKTSLNNSNAIEDLDLIVSPLDPNAPSRETFRGNPVAALADPGIPVTPVNSTQNTSNEKSPPILSQLEAIEKSINNRLLELEDSSNKELDNP